MIPNTNEKVKVRTYRRSTLAVIGLFIAACLVLIAGGIINFYANPTNETPLEIENQELSIELEQQKLEKEVLAQKAKEEPTFKPYTYTNEPPVINANAYGIFYRENSNDEFIDYYLYKEDSVLPPASITKLMTALVALEKYDIDKQILVPTQCVNINGSSIGLKAFEVYKLEDLLYGLLVKSAADAGCAISSIEGTSKFVLEMNKKATELGMDNTQFQNEIGFDAGNSQVSTIEDLKILTTETLKSSILRKIVGTELYELSPLNSSVVYRLENTNDLLNSIPGSIGVKTGRTDEAGECLSYVYENGEMEVMIIILGSQDRFGDTKRLLEWANEEIESNKEDTIISDGIDSPDDINSTNNPEVQGVSTTNSTQNKPTVKPQTNVSPDPSENVIETKNIDPTKNVKQVAPSSNSNSVPAGYYQQNSQSSR